MCRTSDSGPFLDDKGQPFPLSLQLFAFEQRGHSARAQSWPAASRAATAGANLDLTVNPLFAHFHITEPLKYKTHVLEVCSFSR